SRLAAGALASGPRPLGRLVAAPSSRDTLRGSLYYNGRTRKVASGSDAVEAPINSRKRPQTRRLGWRRRPDLNRRVEVLQTSALTTWLRRPERSTIEERRRSIKIRREATRPGASCVTAAQPE